MTDPCYNKTAECEPEHLEHWNPETLVTDLSPSNKFDEADSEILEDGTSSKAAVHLSQSMNSDDFLFKELDCLDSLPHVVENLSHAQKQQDTEIEDYHRMLHNVKERLQKETEMLRDLQDEVGMLRRDVCLAEEDCSLVSQRCNKIQIDLDTALMDNFQNMKEHRTVEKKMIIDDRLFSKYHDKMNKHRQLVHEVESSTALHKEVKQQRTKINSLQEEKEAMTRDLATNTNQNTDQNPQGEVKTLMETRDRLVACIEEMTKQKRNNAQRTRLKRQLKEAQQRNYQWQDEARQLEGTIRRLREVTEE